MAARDGTRAGTAANLRGAQLDKRARTPPATRGHANSHGRHGAGSALRRERAAAPRAGPRMAAGETADAVALEAPRAHGRWLVAACQAPGLSAAEARPRLRG